MVPLLVASALELAAARAEDAIAVSHGRRTITYGELDSYSSALAFALERRGVEEGDHVATLLDGVEAVVAFWAIAKAGAVAVALDEADGDELAAILRDVDARAFVVDAAIAPTHHHAVARAPRLRAVIARGFRAEDAAGSAVYVSYETALAEEDPLSRGLPARRIDLDDAWLERDDDDVLRAISHRALLSRAASVALGVGIGPNDTVGGTAFAELAVACALAGACFRTSGEELATGRALWICSMDEDAPPPAGATMVELYRRIDCGPVAIVTASPNDPARVVPNVDVRIVDEKGEPVATKVIGEIAVRSSSLREPSGGYFRTGDSGMLDDAGALYVL